MKQITTFEELIDLPLYESVLIFTGTSHHTYKKIGYRSEQKNLVILSSDLEITKAVGISKYDFVATNKKYFTGKFDSNFIGNLIIEHHTKEIEDIKKIYLNEI